MMRRGRIYFKLGVLIFLVLAGAAFFLLVPVSSEVAVVAVEAPVEAVGAVGAVGLEALPWILIMGIGLAVLLTFLGRMRQNAALRNTSKRKHDDEVAPYLDEMIEQGVVRLEDDGELPDLTADDLYLDEKPKRSEDDD
jgi:hypothetical protein